MNSKAAVFILLGQSNATGHAVPMAEEDRIKTPLRHVFGLTRKENQTLHAKKLFWSGWTGAGTNLAESQDDTWSIATCLALAWEKAIAAGSALPDLYVVHVAVGAEGMLGMWHPDRPEKLLPGPLGTVDISLCPYTEHVLSLLPESLAERGLTPDYVGIHWRGGEEDSGKRVGELRGVLPELYRRMFISFDRALGATPPLTLYTMCHVERSLAMHPEGFGPESMAYINSLFSEIRDRRGNVELFDIRTAPFWVPDVPTHGIWLEDCIHATPELNRWIAGRILQNYAAKNEIILNEVIFKEEI